MQWLLLTAKSEASIYFDHGKVLQQISSGNGTPFLRKNK